MCRWWVKGRLRVLGLLAATLLWASGPVPARSLLDLDVAQQPAMLLDWGDYQITDASPVAPAAIAQRPAQSWSPTQPGSIYPLGPGRALWIRFTVPPAPDNERWYVKLPDAGLDMVTLYTQGSDGAWSGQSAGDRLAVSRWALPNLYPILPISVSAADPTRYLLRIEASGGFSTPIMFVSETHLGVEQQRISLAHGVYFGLITMVAIFGLISAAVMRDIAYVWFGLFGVLAASAVASAVGVAGLHLWPGLAEWNDAAPYVLPTLSMAPLMMFVAHGISLRGRSARVFWLFCAAAVGAVVAAVFAERLDNPQRLYLAVGTLVALALLALGGVCWAWYHGDRFARWLALAFLPLLLALPFPVARSLDWLSLGFLTQHSLQLALAVTLPALFLLLILRSNERRDYRKRITQLDQVDPLTGLANDNVFHHRLRGLIERSRRFNVEGAVVLVDFTNMHRLREEFGRKAVVEVLLRTAGRLTSLMRDMDTVARIGEGRYGILVEGPVPPERAAQLGSKIMGRCIMPFSRMPQGLLFKPKIAVALVPSHGGSADEVVAMLDGLLKQASPDYRKNIFVAGASAAASSAPPSQPLAANG